MRLTSRRLVRLIPPRAAVNRRRGPFNRGGGSARCRLASLRRPLQRVDGLPAGLGHGWVPRRFLLLIQHRLDAVERLCIPRGQAPRELLLLAERRAAWVIHLRAGRVMPEARQQLIGPRRLTPAEG